MDRTRVAELKKSCLPRLSLDTLSSEHTVFSKMLYRARNQHKHDKSFQRMDGVSRSIIKYLTVKIAAKLKKIINKLYSMKANVKCIPLDTVKIIEEMYLQLLEAATFTTDLLQFTEDTWREVNQRLMRGLFVPFNTVMLASLSRIWYCLRYHVLSIAETYAVLKNAAPQTTAPVSHVLVHLKQCHRAYLDSPSLPFHLKPRASTPLERNPVMTTDDMGVVIELTEEELQARKTDIGLPLQSLGVPEQPSQPRSEDSIVSAGSRAVDYRQPGVSVNSGKDVSKKTRKRTRSQRKRTCKKRMLKSTNNPQPSTPLVPEVLADDNSSPAIETKSAKEGEKKKKKKKKRYKEIRAKRLQKAKARLPITGSFRMIVMKQAGKQRMIIGRKTWMKKQSSKRGALKKRQVSTLNTRTVHSLLASEHSSTDVLTSTSGLNILASGTNCSLTDKSATNSLDYSGIFGEEERVRHMQALYQRYLDSAVMKKIEAEKKGAECTGEDDIDRIFSNLQ